MQDEIKIDDHKHFLGRGLACVVLSRLGGRGPAMLPGPMQRDLVPGQVKHLFQIGGGITADKLLRTDPAHELVMGISGNLLII